MKDVGGLTKYVLSVCAPNASVVYAVSPLAKSDVKSQNFPSKRELRRRYSWLKVRKRTMSLSEKADSFRELLRVFWRRWDARNERETELILPMTSVEGW